MFVTDHHHILRLCTEIAPVFLEFSGHKTTKTNTNPKITLTLTDCCSLSVVVFVAAARTSLQ